MVLMMAVEDYLKVDKTLKTLGLRKVTGEEAMYTFNTEKGLEGIVILHVDGFDMGGNANFHENVTKKIQEVFDFGKVEESNFRFTGIDITETEDFIEANQNEYRNSLEIIKVEDKSDEERELTLAEYKQFRGMIGKLNWLQEQTRPDIAHETLLMSMKSRKAKVSDINKLNKIVKRAKEKECFVRYKHIDKKENLYIAALADASYRKIDDKTRSTEGRILLLTNGEKASPLLWKSRRIAQVCDSTKTAESRAADKVVDDAIFYARMIEEIYSGKVSLGQIPVVVYTDNNPLYESIHSTKPVERKTIRHVIQGLKDSLERGGSEAV